MKTKIPAGTKKRRKRFVAPETNISGRTEEGARDTLTYMNWCRVHVSPEVEALVGRWRRYKKNYLLKFRKQR